MPTKALYAKKAYVYRSRRIIRLIVALIVGLTGAANMWFAILPRPDWDMLLGAWPLDTHHGLYKLTVVIGFFLIMLSYGLARGKRGAWRVAIILLLLSTILHILSGGQVLPTIGTGALVALLAACSRCFQAKSDPPSLRRGSVALVVGLSIVLIYTIHGLFVLYDQFEAPVDRIGIEDFLARVFAHTHWYLTPGTQAFVFGRAVPLLCLSVFLYGIVMILRPVAAALFPTEQQQESVAALAHRYGKNSISYFALEPGKSYFFTDSGKSVISYVLEGNVAVVAGDPIGPEEEMLPAIQQFMAFCQEQDWMVVFWQVRDALIDLYQAAKLHVLKIGEDAIVPTRTFTLSGKAMANVRSSAKRAEKEGVRVVFWRGRVQDIDQLAQMEQISRSWLARKGGSEMGFSMGRFDPYGDKEQMYALAVDKTNRVHAFVTFVPIYGRNGWGLDLMRRADQAAPGAMERLLASSIEHLGMEGADVVSLGLAPMSDVNCANHTLLGTSMNFLTQHFGNPRKNRSLFNFKKKFQPRWESRYLVYSSTLTLPKVGWALYRAHQRDVSLLTTLYRSLKGLSVRHKALAGSTAPSASGTLML
ncbi:MAG TPA: phosphatidylglycerol lysyltransferase domain-containing protein [Ktedonobacteraceae bacterium]|nr:phosphatidylglycerol lysyltransferase domain-containing protein [Ktedonobacteraceae bacterium]